jgi:mannitol-1-phosphate 5-dehydrogenase
MVPVSDDRGGRTVAADDRPIVVQFGAGAIGRGFLGQLWSEAGYRVVFVDADRDVVRELNRRGSYPLRLIGPDGERTVTVGPVQAYHTDDGPMINWLLSRCAFAATAVGAERVGEVGSRFLARGLALRYRGYRTPLNVLCCENGTGAPHALQAGVLGALPFGDATVRRYKVERLGVVQTVIGRMVPPPGTVNDPDPLLVAAEPYARLPFDATDWRGPIPDVPGLVPVHTPQKWSLERRRKLYTHNGGHAVLAYHGALRGLPTIWRAAEDPAVAAELRGFWAEVDAALAADPAAGPVFDAAYQQGHEDDLMRRFRNRALGDTVERVGRDPARKLARDDRLVGAGLLCLQHGVTPRHVARATAAALRFDAPGDPSSARVREAVRAGGVRGALAEFAGLPPDHPFVALVESEAAAAGANG